MKVPNPSAVAPAAERNAEVQPSVSAPVPAFVAPGLAGAAALSAVLMAPTIAQADADRAGLRLTTFSADSLDPALPLSPTAAVALAALLLAVSLAAIVVAAVSCRRLARARRALAAAEARFDRLAEQGGDVVLRLRGSERRISPAIVDLLGYEAEEMRTRDWTELLHPDDVGGVEVARDLAERHGFHTVACRLIHRGGAIRFVEAAMSRIDDDVAPELFVTLRDVTARQEENESLRRATEAARAAEIAAGEATRAKGDFLASMSHEIRTPLNAIIGFADLLVADARLGPAARQHAERVKVGGDALLTVVNDILDYSQVESGALQLDPRPFALPLLVDECVALVERAAVARHLTLHVEIVGRLPAGVTGDEARLRQILLNLLNNAIKFTHAGSVILRIRHEPGGEGRTTFEVEDTGIGIADADLPCLFQRFRQVDGTIRRTYGGTGLGLAISKMLVERMGGTIGVRSAPGTGSTFWFALDLPLAALKLESARERRTAAPVRAQRVLLVEDVRLNQELVLAVLESQGHLVEVVGDGADAIMAADEGGYDLVLMDIQMPHVDGMSATRAIRRLPHAGRLVPIVAMSANVLPDQVEAALASGMDDFVSKPLTLDAIGSLLARSGRGEVRPTPDAAALDGAVLDKLAAILGEAKIAAMLATLRASLLARFDRPLAPETAPALKAEAHAAIAGAAMLGFTAFSGACRRFIDAGETDDLGELHDRLLRELGRVLRAAEARAAKGGSRRAA